jgi:hypothetical protein
MEGFLVAGESDEPDLALLSCLGERLKNPFDLVSEFGIVVEDDIMYLPNVDVVSLQARKRVFEHAYGDVFLAAVSADAGHKNGLVAFALKRDA